MGIIMKDNVFTEGNMPDDLEAHLTDGRLTDTNSGKWYRIREIEKKEKELGRPLTPEELAFYEENE